MTRVSVAVLGLLTLTAIPLVAQQFAQDPKQIVREAVATELQAAKADDSHWRYRDDERSHMERLFLLSPRIIEF